MTRLVGWMKDSIVGSIIELRFKGAYEEFCEEYSKLALAIYNDVFPVSVRRKMQRLPAGWLPAVHAIGVQFGDDSRGYYNLDFNGDVSGSHRQPGPGPLRFRSSTIPPSIHRRMPYEKKNSCLVNYQTSAPLAKQYFDIANRLQAKIAELAEAKKLAGQAVEQASTVAKLIEVWPEVKPFAKRFLNNDASSDRTLPAVRLTEVNKALGLPVP